MIFNMPLKHLQQLVHIDNNMKIFVALLAALLETVIFCQSITPGQKTAQKNNGVTFITNNKLLQALMHNWQLNNFCCVLLRLHDEFCKWSARRRRGLMRRVRQPRSQRASRACVHGLLVSHSPLCKRLNEPASAVERARFGGCSEPASAVYRARCASGYM